MLQLIPGAAVVLLNLIVIVYVWLERSRTQSGTFLFINSFSLILWTLGLAVWRAMDHDPALLVLPAMGSALIPANLLYFTATQPKPLTTFQNRESLGWLIFVPPLILCLFIDYGQASPIREFSPYIYSQWRQLWNAEGGPQFLLDMALLMAAIAVLAARYNSAEPGPERNLPRHLLLAILAPIIFTVLFSIITASTNVTLLPSPGVIMAVIAQVCALAVIRQEEVLRPLYLSRWIYYSIIVLFGFLVSTMVYTLYESIARTVLMTPAVHMTIIITLILFLVAGSLPPVQAVFDRLMFSRAWEYRRLVREAQMELHETRQRLRQAERLSVVGEMAARIAHEIKNPLGPIKGYTQMMRERLDTMEDFPQRMSFLRKLDIISEEVENIDRRVRHLLDLSRKPRLIMQPEDINKIVSRAAVLLRLEAETLNRGTGPRDQAIQVIEDLDPDLPEAHVSRPFIEEALFNLCRNAFEAIGGEGTITLSTRTRASSSGEDGVEIVVEDTGPGISQEALDRLFEPFYTEKAGGTGLGLAIVRSHMEMHSGTLQFERGRERGTLVSLWIPLNPPAASETSLEFEEKEASPQPIR